MENLSKKHEVKEVEVKQDDSKRGSKKRFSPIFRNHTKREIKRKKGKLKPRTNKQQDPT